MSDYNYGFHGCYELTLEISCCKYPPAEQLSAFWEENRKSLLEFVKQAHRGVTGVVLDADTQLPVNNASLTIIGRDIAFATSNRGEFWRLLLPGRYTLKVQAKGFHPNEVNFEVKAYKELPKLTSLIVLLLNETKPAPTTTTSTAATTMKVTTVYTTRRPEAIIQKKVTTLEKPVYFKQISSRNAYLSSATVFRLSPSLSVIAILSIIRFL